jgi:hypothetical protein
MARLRNPVRAPAAYTASFIVSSRPAKREWQRRMRSNFSVGSWPVISDAAVMAPALIIGLRGRSVTGSRLISLNGGDGLDGERRGGLAGTVYPAVRGGQAQYERIRLRCSEFRDVIGQFAGAVGPAQFVDIDDDARHDAEVDRLRKLLLWLGHTITLGAVAYGRPDMRPAKRVSVDGVRPAVLRVEPHISALCRQVTCSGRAEPLPRLRRLFGSDALSGGSEFRWECFPGSIHPQTCTG